MSQQIRLEYPGSLWHITVRGTNCEMFRDDIDRKLFLKLLATCAMRSRWIVCAYVLLPRELRLVLKLTGPTMSRGMQWLNSTYAQRFNRRHDRVGHLVHGRFDGCLVDEATYFDEIVRDVVLSPVRARLVAAPDQYLWSSHRAMTGQAYAPQWLAVDDVLARFGSSRETYRAFVDARPRRPFNFRAAIVGDIYAGSDAWLREVRNQLATKLRSDARSVMQRTLCTIEIGDVIDAVAESWSIAPSAIRNRRGGVPRMVVAWVASNETLVTGRQIAAALRLRSSGRVTALIRDCDRALDRSARLREFVGRSISTLRRKM